jgi:hypothetical protein
MSRPAPKFAVGEIAILQPPHPSARAYWGEETTIIRLYWMTNGEDAMRGRSYGWYYETDIPAPPPTDLPEDQHKKWIWSEYDLKKKYEPGMDYESLIEELNNSLVTY